MIPRADTFEQIAMWRKALLPIIGRSALELPESEIRAIRDRMQQQLEQKDEPKKDVPAGGV